MVKRHQWKEITGTQKNTPRKQLAPKRYATHCAQRQPRITCIDADEKSGNASIRRQPEQRMPFLARDSARAPAAVLRLSWTSAQQTPEWFSLQ
jgi:glycine/D-amino acid oxidase-like deaminating enzyme